MTTAHDSHDHGFAHPVSKKLLYGVFFALVLLTIITVVANDLPLGKLDLWVAMGIASIKAFLVMAFFMHMWWEKGINIVFFLSSVLFAVLFVGFLLLDTDSYKEDVEIFPVDLRPGATEVISPLKPVSETPH
ncbi:MAG TPA: cytochrome C oxidase subunit IV family protein [Pirellulaceae bacterium]|nr:cytochrome C oxidase subunit IV family protein [Pirellulaceae bacterium]HMO92258.1 cytochrome C oxidase subunit IV family protein [Pirellulaceae bacterium]HMP70074.1 cytochrome C oxidase subunit IV family protein [Pirellulaceae bacterium]